MKRSFLPGILMVAMVYQGISQNTNSGFSPPIIIDTQHPEVQVLSPSGGEVFNFLLPLPVTWQAYDSHPTEWPIQIGFSTQAGGDTLMLENLFPNTGSAEPLPPQIPTQEAGVYVKMTDAFGNSAIAAGNGFFSLTGCPPPVLYAGADAMLCEGEPFYLADATTENLEIFQWTVVNGYGIFSDPTALNPVYYPSAHDYLAGCITLLVEGWGTFPCDVWISDSLQLCFQPPPVAGAGADAWIPEGDSFIILDAYAAHYSEIIWSTSGDGTFSNLHSINTSYEPGLQDIGNQYVMLQLTAMPVSPCSAPVVDELILHLEPAMYVQDIDIPMGWSGLSGYVIPSVPGMELIFSSIQNQLVIVQGVNGMYWPGQNINTLVNWNTHQGYQVKVNDDVILMLSGFYEHNKVLPAGAGWNLIPVLSEASVDVGELLLPTSAVMAKEVAGTGIYWPAMGINTLRFLDPGRAYYVLFANPDEIIYPSYTKHQRIEPFHRTQALVAPWQMVRSTAISHVVALPPEVLVNFTPGDFVGAFDQKGQCCGFAQIGNETGALVIYADDPVTPVKDGFMEDEPMSFILYQANAGTQVPLRVEFSADFPDKFPVFAGNGLSVMEWTELPASGTIPESGLVIQPNPAQDYFTVSAGGISLENVRLTLINPEGMRVNEVILNGDDQRIDISALSPGLYMVNIETPERSWHRQLIKY